MTYEEFEWHVLRMVYEEGARRMHPSFLAYSLGLPHEIVNQYLEHAVESGLLEPEVTDSGQLEYAVPGAHGSETLPTPIWRRETPEPPAPEPAPADPPPTVRVEERRRPPAEPAASPIVRREGAQTDGTLYHQMVAARDAVIERNAVIERGARTTDARPADGAMVAWSPSGAGALARVEASADAVCDSSQTRFSRQIRVRGITDEGALRDQIQQLFENFGYRPVRVARDRLLFERGSVTFILALVPLIVLIVPLFIYLFLYIMGHSMIQQEPLHLDVQLFERDEEGTYDIDLTFVGQHGVILSAADQRVLNREVDTLRDELQWALAAV